MPLRIASHHAFKALATLLVCTLAAHGGAQSWSTVGPSQVQTQKYGLITGRVTSLAIDPSDTTNNTVYLGTAGGGVWKSTNAAGPSTAVSFSPLTDTLPAFSPNAGSSATPSLSIGALAVQPGATGVVLAGTGDPNNATDSHYGVGILRSTDNGTTWSLITGGSSGSFTGEAFAGFAWSTVSPSLVIAAVTSSAQAASVGASRGVRGLYYSTDAGVTWALATIEDGSTVIQNSTTSFATFRGNSATSVVWNPIRQKFYAAVRTHGYYESSDGITWTRLANQPGAGLTTTNCPPRAGTDGLAICPLFRGALAVQPVSGDIFALTVDAANRNQGLWQNTCAKSGGTCASNTVAWSTQIDTSAMESASIIPGADYNLALAAMPAATALSLTDTLLFTGTQDIYRCGLSGGCTLRNTTNATNACANPAGVAPAQHAIAWGLNTANSAEPFLFFGNDGGLWRSLDGVHQQSTVCSADDATHFDNLNGSLNSIAEVLQLAAHPRDANIVLASLGRNGSASSSTATQASGTAAWTQLSAEPSGTATIDQISGNTWILQAGTGVALHTCTNSPACTSTDFASAATIGTAQTGNDVTLAYSPSLIDPALSSNILVGTCRVWRGPTSGGSNWSSANAISASLGGTCSSSNPKIRALAAGGPSATTISTQTSGSTVLYAALAGGTGSSLDGHIFINRAANTSTTWTDLTNNAVTNDTGTRFNANGFDISSIAVDASDTTGSTVYATVMGFSVPHVYRSTDAGTTWRNISANLPNAPANSIAVDPRNPHVVYVAMDSGVYVTTDVTACAPPTGTTACWSTLGTSLPNAPVLSLTTSPGIASGVMRAATGGRGIWQTALISATSQPLASLSPAVLTFAPQNLASTSTAQTVTLTNTGNTAMQIGAVTSSSNFSETDTCASQQLAVNATCALTVVFSPTIAGAITGTVRINADVPGGYASVVLNGVGQGAAGLILLPTSADFGTQITGTSSTATNITISNTSTHSITLGNITVTGDFTLRANTCGTSLPSQTGCTVSVVFTPTTTGPRSGTLSVASDAGTQTASITGVGVAAATDVLSPLALTFATQQAGTISATQFVNLTNNGDVPLTLVSAQIVAGDFTVVSSCGPTLAAHTTCRFAVSFAPKSVGPLTGILQISDVQRVQTVTLSGTAIAGPGVTLLPANLTFANTGVGTSGAGQTLTLTNNGGVPLQLSAITVAGNFGIVAGSNTCSLTSPLAVSDSCSVTIAFLPTSSGPLAGTVTATSNGPTQVARLSGTGIDFTLQSSGATTQTISNGGSAAYPLLLRPAFNTNDPVTYACTGVPANAKCNIIAQYTTLAAVSTVTVTVATGTAARNIRAIWLLPLLFGVPWCLKRRRIALTALVLLFVIQGCGNSRRIADAGDGTNTGTAPITPSGSYNVVISASAAGVTRTVPLTLIVN